MTKQKKMVKNLVRKKKIMGYIKSQNKEYAKGTSGMLKYLGNSRHDRTKLFNLKGEVSGNRSRIHAQSYLAKIIGTGNLKIK